jgi:transcription antitermination factor NusG
MGHFKEGWYVIYTKPRHEKKVHSRLAQMNINSFLPLKKKLHAGRTMRRFVDEPLFSSYIFIYLNDLQSYYHGIDTEGALYYVRNGKEIARVGETVINNIRLAVDHGGDFEVSEQRFLCGTKLVIGKGALTGLACEVVQSNNKHKLLVRVELLQRNILLSLPEEHLVTG